MPFYVVKDTRLEAKRASFTSCLAVTWKSGKYLLYSTFLLTIYPFLIDF